VTPKTLRPSTFNHDAIGNDASEVSLRVVETSLRVRYSETDRMGIVYHANYIIWFEIGRTNYCREAGMPYRAMEDSGLLILVTAVNCKYRRPARYDDAVRVRSRLTELGSRGLAFGYAIADEENRILAEGATRHVFADVSGRPRRAPAAILEKLERFRES
jgi:acyl-CoA thioester hydrolase